MANNRVHKAENLKPDLVLLEVGLPKLNGIDACRFIRKRAPQALVVFLSQESDVDVVNARWMRALWDTYSKNELDSR